MGGVPRYALVSLGLPLETEVEDVISLYRGMLKLAKLTGTAVAGGNMSGSPCLFIDINVLGVTGNPEGKYLKRSTARPGDKIAVTGWLGTAAAGLEMLTRKLEFGPSVSAGLKQAFTQPEPRLNEGRLLIEKGIETGIDISDGLLADLNHICRESGVSAELELERIPVRQEVISAFGDKAYQMALSGGEDYQLLFTGRTSLIESVREASGYPVTVIGEITAGNAGEIILVDREGRRSPVAAAGWDHFKR
jgi:thiamine-monophosphate kinase